MVFRLDLADFSMHEVETVGPKPERGIHKHRVRLVVGCDGEGNWLRVTRKNPEKQYWDSDTESECDGEEDEGDGEEPGEDLAYEEDETDGGVQLDGED